MELSISLVELSKVEETNTQTRKMNSTMANATEFSVDTKE